MIEEQMREIVREGIEASGQYRLRSISRRCIVVFTWLLILSADVAYLNLLCEGHQVGECRGVDTAALAHESFISHRK